MGAGLSYLVPAAYDGGRNKGRKREAKKMKTVHLQGMGNYAGSPAKNLQSGDRIMWNYGCIEEVVAVSPSTTGKTVKAILKSVVDSYGRAIHEGAIGTRKLGAERLVVVTKKR